MFMKPRMIKIRKDEIIKKGKKSAQSLEVHE